MDTSVWVSILSSGCGFFIALGSKSSNPFPYLTFMNFTLLVFHILVVQLRIPLRDLLFYFFFLFRWWCLILVPWIAGNPLSPLLSLSSEDWMVFSTDLANFSRLWLDPSLYFLSGSLMEVPPHSHGLCTLQFPWYFPPISLLHQFHSVSFQVLI